MPALKGGSIYVNWNGITSPTSTDWVGIYVPGSADTAYFDWDYTNGSSSGTVNVTLNHPSIVAGATYEARLYANDGYTLLAKSAPFVVNPTGTVVAVTTAPAVKGQSLTVKWNGIASPTTWDWVGIYTPGSNDFAYLDWAYTNGGSSGTVNVTLSHPSIVAGGTYEARLYANDGYTLLAKTPPFTVVAGTSGSYTLYYVHNDHLGTPQALTNDAGAVVWRGVYDPFGQATVNEDPDGDGQRVVMNRRLPGMYADSETGLFYNGFRYYDPKIGGYITADPVDVVPGVADSPRVPHEITQYFRSVPLNTRLVRGLNHPYRYASNNPLRFVDPLGLAPGDPYASQHEAAHAAINDVNPWSILENTEYGGMIYKNPNGAYSYTSPNTGGTASVNPGGPAACPSETTPKAYYHTHGAYDPRYDNENFSPADIRYGDIYDIDGYLGTPNGYFKYYNYSTGSENTIGNVMTPP